MKKLIISGVLLACCSLLPVAHTQDMTLVSDNTKKPRLTDSDIEKQLKGLPYMKSKDKLNYDKRIKQVYEIERIIAEKKREERQKAELERQREEQQRIAKQQTKVQQAHENQHAQVNNTVNKRTLNIEFSYYTATCNGCSGITATGIDVRNTVYYQGMRILATDPNVIPTWSIVQFELDGQMVKGIALDTGGYIKGNKVDMLVGSVSEAYKRGRHMKQVQIIRYGK